MEYITYYCAWNTKNLLMCKLYPFLFRSFQDSHTHTHSGYIFTYRLTFNIFKRFLDYRLAIVFVLAFQFQQIAVSAQSEVVYKPLYTEEAFNNRALDVNLPVGSMAGEAGVANGAAMYHIPIVVPPGTNGVVPNLSINYNSMAGNGMLGRGWSLSGLSSISRVPGRLYYDDDVYPEIGRAHV